MKKYDILKIENEEYAVLNKECENQINEKKYKSKLKSSGIPHFYWKIDFKDYKGDKSIKEIERIKRYAERCHTKDFNYVHLYLWGGNNVQKTALACNVGKQAIKKGMKVKFVLANRLIDRLMKNQGFNYYEDIEDYLNQLKRQDLLIIDDGFDTEKSLMWRNSDNKNLIVSEWDGFLRNVVASQTRVIITSNLSIVNISKYYSKSLEELIDRNFIKLNLLDNVKTVRKMNLENLLEED